MASTVGTTDGTARCPSPRTGMGATHRDLLTVCAPAWIPHLTLRTAEAASTNPQIRRGPTGSPTPTVESPEFNHGGCQFRGPLDHFQPDIGINNKYLRMHSDSLWQRHQMNRRRFVGGAGMVLGLGGLPGCSLQSANSNTTPPPDDRVQTILEETDVYDTVINVVDEGVDPDGDQSITPFLQENAADNRLLYFPAGTYLVDERVDLPSVSHFGLVGDGAVIRPGEDFSGYLLVADKETEATGVHIEGFEFDFRDRNELLRAIHAQVAGDLLVRDVTVRGVQRTDSALVRFDVMSGSGVVERLILPDGGIPNSRAIGCLVGPLSRGKLRFVDCHIAGFPNNGLYASSAPGSVVVEGGSYRNNDIANVRVGDGSTVRGVYIECAIDSKNVSNMRGIRLRRGSDVLVEDCQIKLSDVSSSDGAIVISRGLNSATIRNTSIRLTTDSVPAIWAKTPHSPDAASTADGLQCEHVTIDGAAESGSTIIIDGRDGCTLEDLCIRHPDGNRNGINVRHTDSGTVQNVSIDVGGEPIAITASTVQMANIVTDPPFPQCE